MCNLFSPDPPPPVDYQGAAAAQGAANRETAIAQGHINNPNVVNPYGSQTVTWNGEQPTITQQLSPEQQGLLDSRTRTQQGMSALAGQGIGSLRGLIGTAMNFGEAPMRGRALGYPAANTPTGNPAWRGGPPIMGGEGSDPNNANPIARAPLGGKSGEEAPMVAAGKSIPMMASGEGVVMAPKAASADASARDGTFLDDYRQQGSDYGGKASNFTGIDPNTGYQYINGHQFVGEGMTQSGDKSVPGKGFQDILNMYGPQIAQLTGQAPPTTAPNPLPIPGTDSPITPPGGGSPQGAPGAPQGPPGSGPPPPQGPSGAPPGAPPNGPSQNIPGLDPYDGIQLPNVEGVPSALNPNALPGMAGPLNSRMLPRLSSAEQTRQNVIDAMMGRTNTDLSKRQDQMNSDLIARGIRPGTEAYSREQDMLERSRNDARQQAEIAGGNAAQQEFGMNLSRRQQLAGEQGQTFSQSAANRGMAAGEQGQAFQQALTGGAQRFSQTGQRAQMQQQLQSQGFSQENQNRRDAIAEMLAQRQTPLNEISALMGGSGVSNPFSVPGYAQNTSVAPPPIFGAAQAQGQAANNIYNAQTGTYNSMLGGAASLGGSLLGVPGIAAML